jgi:hypothetical protein
MPSRPSSPHVSRRYSHHEHPAALKERSMSIHGISGATRATLPVNPVQPAEPAAAEPRPPASLIEIDAKTRQPVPLRFPWLSRLSTELEKAAGQPAPFGKNPELGDQVNTKV